MNFLAAVTLNTLPVRQAHVRHVRHGLLQEGVDQGDFANARFPREKDDLSLVVQRLVQALSP